MKIDPKGRPTAADLLSNHPFLLPLRVTPIITSFKSTTVVSPVTSIIATTTVTPSVVENECKEKITEDNIIKETVTTYVA